MKKMFKAATTLAMLFLVNIIIIGMVQGLPSAEAAYRQGSTGSTVKQIQTRLKQWGYYTGNIDGIYGSLTTKAVKNFQWKNGLTVDGIAGRKTLAAIGISTGSQNSQTTSRDNDLEMLARIISAEGRGEPYKGQVAIGAVIMNRVKSPTFPNTIGGVIYQPGAFTAVSDGQFYNAASASSIKAAAEAYNGTDPTAGCLYYYNPAKTTNKYMLSKPVILRIGSHNFCK